MIKRNLFSIVIVLFLLNSCDKKDPIIPNEEEVITTLNFTLTDNTGKQVVMQFKDLNGGVNPIIKGGKLDSNTLYMATLVLLNELGTPIKDITEEILSEGVDHQFFFESTVMGMTIAYNDVDDNLQPIGVKALVSTQDAGVGTLKITLRHQPDKSAVGVLNGMIDNAGGETDLEVIFDVNVE